MADEFVLERVAWHTGYKRRLVTQTHLAVPGSAVTLCGFLLPTDTPWLLAGDGLCRFCRVAAEGPPFKSGPHPPIRVTR